MAVCVPCGAEIHPGAGLGGEVLHQSLPQAGPELCARYGGQVQALYMDPPFFTKQQFQLKLGVGEDGWRHGKQSMILPAYDDRWASEAAYLGMMEEILTIAHDLLREDGALFLHIDHRMSAKLRLMLDARFGEGNFVNEIIWVYQTGGRARHHFSRKHDTILFYRKSKKLFFDLQAVPISREGQRNHMKRSVDDMGRSFRSIRVGGKEYRYYDDAPAYPSDVWEDVSHLQQKDPQRTGYDSQKPLALLQRIIACSTRPGDLVCDLFLGSGTTAVAASGMGRRFLGVDASPSAIVTARKRLLGQKLILRGETAQGKPLIRCRVEPSEERVGVYLEQYEMEAGLCPHASKQLSHVDQWSAGYLREGVFHGLAHSARSKASPKLQEGLEIPMNAGDLAVLTVDLLGRRMIHRLMA